MEKEEAWQGLRELKEEIESLKLLHPDNPKFKVWKNELSLVAEVAFGKDSEEYQRLNDPSTFMSHRTRTAAGPLTRYDYMLEDYEVEIQNTLKIHEILGISAPFQAAVSAPPTASQGSMKAFLSYSHKDKALAGQMKHSLEDLFGVDVFLAHEDIVPSDRWRKRIENELKACHVFVPILTARFRYSKWTDQETGFALARGIPIIPIDAGSKPYGFVGKYQALPLDLGHIRNFCLRIAKAIVSHPKEGKIFLDTLIRHFGHSSCFIESNARSKILSEFKPSYTTEQKNDIIRLSAENDQIYKSNVANKIVSSFINEFEDELHPSLIAAFPKRQHHE